MKRTLLKLLSVAMVLALLSGVCVTAFAKYCDYTYTCLSCGEKAVFEAPIEDFEATLCPKCGGKFNSASYSYTHVTYPDVCLYCFHVALNEEQSPADACCTECGKQYRRQNLPAIGENGELLYGGGGTDLHYCTVTSKFWQGDVCPYAPGEHTDKPVKVVYQAICPQCGVVNCRNTSDMFTEPFLLGTLNNAFMQIAIDITGSLTQEDIQKMDLSNACTACKCKFTAENIEIHRYVDAPDGAQYEENDADKPFAESEYYARNGSENDSLREAILWKIANFFKNIGYYLMLIFSGGKR